MDMWKSKPPTLEEGVLSNSPFQIDKWQTCDEVEIQPALKEVDLFKLPNYCSNCADPQWSCYTDEFPADDYCWWRDNGYDWSWLEFYSRWKSYRSTSEVNPCFHNACGKGDGNPIVPNCEPACPAYLIWQENYSGGC